MILLAHILTYFVLKIYEHVEYIPICIYVCVCIFLFFSKTSKIDYLFIYYQNIGFHGARAPKHRTIEVVPTVGFSEVR